MSKKENPKNPIKKDSTTDFFLNFITRQKSEQKDEEKTTTSKVVDDTVKVRDKAFELFYHMINSLNIFLDRMLQSNLSMKVLSFVMAVVLLFTITGGIDNIFSTPNGGDYLYDVKIDTEGLQSDYDVVGLPETVNVALVGPSLDIYSTKISKKYKVVADFSTLGEGEQRLLSWDTNLVMKIAWILNIQYQLNQWNTMKLKFEVHKTILIKLILLKQ